MIIHPISLLGNAIGKPFEFKNGRLTYQSRKITSILEENYSSVIATLGIDQKLRIEHINDPCSHSVYIPPVQDKVTIGI